MRTREDIEHRREQISGMNPNNDTPIRAQVRRDVVEWISDQLSMESVDFDALWAACEDATDAHYRNARWTPVESSNAPSTPPEPIKPKRKYTRRKPRKAEK